MEYSPALSSGNGKRTIRKNISALILAAGYSSRMGHFKPLSILGSTTAVQRCVNLFKSAGIYDIRVIVGYRHSEITESLSGTGVRTVLNEQFQDGMFSSVKSGLLSFDEFPEAFFMLPVDIPLVRTSSVHEILRNLEGCSADVIFPCFLGKRGHPPLIKGELIPEILKFEGDGGLRGYLNKKTALNAELPDENILRDMDIPEQYRNMMERLTYYNIPSKEECVAFLKHQLKAKENLIKKAELTAEVALRLYEVERKNNSALRPKLITALALLYEAFVDCRSRDLLTTDLSAKFGDSELTQLLKEVSNAPDSSRWVAEESRIVASAYTMVKENDPIGHSQSL